VWRTDMQHLVLHAKCQKNTIFTCWYITHFPGKGKDNRVCILPLCWDVLDMLHDLLQIALSVKWLESAQLLNNGINYATRKLNKTLYQNRDLYIHNFM
jgi:hypothetical protein